MRGPRRIPVVALSALPLDGATGSLAAGFAGYVEKPIDVDRVPGPGAPLLRAGRGADAEPPGGCQHPLRSRRARLALVARRTVRVDGLDAASRSVNIATVGPAAERAPRRGGHAMPVLPDRGRARRARCLARRCLRPPFSPACNGSDERRRRRARRQARRPDARRDRSRSAVPRPLRPASRSSAGSRARTSSSSGATSSRSRPMRRRRRSSSSASTSSSRSRTRRSTPRRRRRRNEAIRSRSSSSIPPIRSGTASSKSLSRPGGNLTGVFGPARCRRQAARDLPAPRAAAPPGAHARRPRRTRGRSDSCRSTRPRPRSCSDRSSWTSARPRTSRISSASSARCVRERSTARSSCRRASGSTTRR